MDSESPQQCDFDPPDFVLEKKIKDFNLGTVIRASNIALKEKKRETLVCSY